MSIITRTGTHTTCREVIAVLCQSVVQSGSHEALGEMFSSCIRQGKGRGVLLMGG